jgi:hypothetical protein
MVFATPLATRCFATSARQIVATIDSELLLSRHLEVWPAVLALSDVGCCDRPSHDGLRGAVNAGPLCASSGGATRTQPRGSSTGTTDRSLYVPRTHCLRSQRAVDILPDHRQQRSAASQLTWSWTPTVRSSIVANKAAPALAPRFSQSATRRGEELPG